MANPTGPAFRSTGAVTGATSVTTCTPVKPGGTAAHGLCLAVIAIKSNAVITTATSGWTKLYQDNAGASFTQAVFIARGDAADPVLSWTGAANAAAYINYYDDPENPLNITTGATAVASGLGTALSVASVTTTNANNVVAVISAIDIASTLSAIALTQTDQNAGSAPAAILFYAGSRFFATSGSTTGILSQTAGASANWVIRQIELLSVVNPTGLWAVEAEFASVNRISTELRSSEVEFASVNQISTELRAAEVEFASVNQISTELRASEVEIAVVFLPGVEPPPPSPAPQISNVRCWPFSLDGHDFYALRLGNQKTLVFDITTGQQVPWETAGRTVWRAHQGLNWLGIGRDIYLAGVPTNVIAGDDSLGVLWSLDPSYAVDDGPTLGDAVVPFTRTITAGIPLRARTSMPCDAIFMVASSGEPFTGQEQISLRTSDDNGKTWQDQGSVALVAGEYSQDIAWRSLGKMSAPGRIFEFTDTGATARIDDITIVVRGQDA